MALIPIVVPLLIVYFLWFLPWKKWRRNIKSAPQEAFPQVRPGVRFYARYFDYGIFSLFLGIILSFAALSILNMPDIFFAVIIIFIWVFVEASLLSVWGTTPGKWLLRITLLDSAGQKLNFSNALHRCFSVWGKGMGVGFATLITLHF